MTAVTEPAGAAPSIPLDPPRPSEEHVSTCNWCWAYWEHSLGADRWMPTGERPGVIGDGPPCPHCERTAYQIRRFIRGKAPQRLQVAICFGCGHVRGLTEGLSPDFWDDAPPSAEAAEATDATEATDASEPTDAAAPTAASAAAAVAAVAVAESDALPATTHPDAAQTPVAVNGAAHPSRFVRYPAVPRSVAAADDDDDQEGGFRSLEPWEVAAFLAWVILALVVLNAWIWWQRARDSGLF